MAAIQEYHSSGLQFCRKSLKAIESKIVTLQVRILSSFFSTHLQGCHGKKAFLSVPGALTLEQHLPHRGGADLFLSVSGALTLEAAMCLTLFVFAAVCLMLPMKVMNTERKMQAALEELGEDFSQYAYIKASIEKGKVFNITGAGDFAKGFCKYLAAGIAEGYAQSQIMLHIDTSAAEHVTMLRSEILLDDETIDLVVDYEIRLPFPILGLPALERTARCQRRAWIGKEGKNYDGTGSSQEGDPDEIVYIGKNSTRYHRIRSCHYLANRMTGVSRDQVSGLRNDYGDKYSPCAVCGQLTGDTVFIMPGGRSYHTTKACTAIVAYVQAVRLSEVEHLGACSYCGK